jgi:P4 family phage/plasmid primase-like protien
MESILAGIKMILIPTQLQNENFRFILLKPKNKTPIESKWESENNYKYDDPKLLKHLESGGNYGVIGGYGKLIIIDSDSKEVNNLISGFPKTFTVKTGSPEEYKNHYYFTTEKQMKAIRLSKNGIGDLGDVRGVGQYVVGPNCIHPCGGTYEIINNEIINFTTKNKIDSVFVTLTVKQSKESGEFKVDTTIRENSYIKYCKMPDYMANNKLKDNTSKNWELFRYIVDILHNRNVSPEIYEKIIQRQGHNVGAIKGWIETARKGTLAKSSCRLMKGYIKKFHPELENEICGNCPLNKENNEFKLSGPLSIVNYIENANLFSKYQPFFFDKSLMFWFWVSDKSKWVMVDEIDLMNAFEKKLDFGGHTVGSKIKNNYLEAFKRVGRINHPKDAPKTWIQFKDKIFDYKTKEIFDATPEYFICNPIPWKLGETNKTPSINKLFKEWVGEKYVKTLYEIIAYCCIIDYPIHLAFCLIGSGRNGKTKFQQLIAKFIGMENISSTELDTLLDSRFESAKLYKKLVCLLGETNFGVIKKTSLLKKLTGQDLIGFEFKRKKPFDDYNYAKVLINSNSLPSSDDTSEGFYRRWLIIDFPNQFKEGKDILEIIPKEEFDNLARKVIEIIPKVLEDGEFTNQGSIEERRKRYIMASNPLPFFIEHACYVNSDDYILSSELYKNYVSFLLKMKRRVVSKKEFSEALLREGFESRRTSHKINDNFVSSYYIEGLSLKNNWESEIMSFMSFMQEFQTYPRIEKFSSEFLHKQHNLHNLDEKVGQKSHILQKNDIFIKDEPKNEVPQEIRVDSNIKQKPRQKIPQITWFELYFPPNEPNLEVSKQELLNDHISEAQISEKLAKGELYECKPGILRRL